MSTRIATGLAAVGTLAASAVLLLVGGGGSAVTTTPVLTGNTEAINVTVTGARSTATPIGSGMCNFTVTSNVTVNDIASVPETALAVTPLVDWAGPANSAGVGVRASFVSAGTPPLAPGDVFQPGVDQTYEGLVTTFTIPCAATTGDLRIEVTDRVGTGSGDDQFLKGGQPLPVAATGAVAGALGIGAVLLGAQGRRRRHPRAA